MAGFKPTNWKNRLNHPEEFRLFELRALDRVLHFSTEDFIELIREVSGE